MFDIVIGIYPFLQTPFYLEGMIYLMQNRKKEALETIELGINRCNEKDKLILLKNYIRSISEPASTIMTLMQEMAKSDTVNKEDLCSVVYEVSLGHELSANGFFNFSKQFYAYFCSTKLIDFTKGTHTKLEDFI